MPKTTPKPQTKNQPLATLPEPAHASTKIDLAAVKARPIEAAIFFAGSARRAAIAGLAAQIFAGAAIAALKKQLNIEPGARTDLSTDPRLAGGWGKFCKTHLHISEDTAANWQRLAGHVFTRLGKLDFTPEELENLASLSEDRFAKLHAAVKKAADGKTATQLLLEFGLLAGGAKRGTTPPAPGDGPSGDDETPAGWSDADWQEYLAADATARNAIDATRSTIAALAIFEAEKASVHAPAHYRDTLTLALENALATLREVQQ